MSKAKIYPSWKDIVAYKKEGPSHTALIKSDNYNAVAVGIDSGQMIPPHPAPDAVYHFLEGNGTMIVDNERLVVKPGTTVVVPSGVSRGIEADTRIGLLASHGAMSKPEPKMMPWKRMGLIGGGSMVLMMAVMAVTSLLIGRSSLMAAFMFRSDGPIGFGMWVLMIAPIVVMFLMMGTMFLTFRRMAKRSRPTMQAAGHHHKHHVNMNRSETRQNGDAKEQVFSVPDVSCDHCKATIESGIGEIEGVYSVSVDVDAKTARIMFAATTSRMSIEAKLRELGYPAK